MNEKMSRVRDVRSHNQLAGRHSSHLLTDWLLWTGDFFQDCFVFPSEAKSSKLNSLHLWTHCILGGNKQPGYEKLIVQPHIIVGVLTKDEEFEYFSDHYYQLLR